MKSAYAKPERECPDVVKTFIHRYLFAAAAGLAICAAACSGEGAAKESGLGAKGVPGMKMPPVPVLAGKVQQRDIPVTLQSIGSVEAYSSVSVKSQVGGQLMEVHFKEGQDVEQGDLLFTIDDRPYKAALHQAEANLAKNQAQAKNAEANRKRYENMIRQDAVAENEYETAKATAESLAAQVMADKAAVENAQLLLSHCMIHAPISGRTGDLMVNEGNLIKANDIELVSINQIEPVYVSFAIPETQIPEVRRHIRESSPLRVEAFAPGEEASGDTGELTFVDNTVDTDTGTIRLKGTFNNPDKRLWPGQFVNVRLTLMTMKDALLVPSEAVQTGQMGQYVYVIKGDNSVENRVISTGMASGNDLVVEKGLGVGETVVTDGHLKIMPGAKVVVKTDLSPTQAKPVAMSAPGGKAPGGKNGAASQ